MKKWSLVQLSRVPISDARVVGSNPARVAMKTQSVRKAVENRLNSISFEKPQSRVSGCC